MDQNALLQAVEDYKNGDKSAFETIYHESSNYLNACIRKIMIGNPNYSDACNDILQDTYVQIVKNIDQLHDTARFLSWAGAIANSRCFKYLEKNKKYSLLEDDGEFWEEIPDDEILIPESVMQNQEQQRIIRELIDNELTSMQRLCIIGYYFYEQKQSEIAAELGIPENTVKTNLSRAKKKLRGAIERFETEEQTKLHSFAPFLLLLLHMDISECAVSSDVSQHILKTCMGRRHVRTGKEAKGQNTGRPAKVSVAKKACMAAGMAAALGIAGMYSRRVFGDYEYDTYYIYRDMQHTDKSDRREMPQDPGAYMESIHIEQQPGVYLLKGQLPIYSEEWIECGYTKENIYVRVYDSIEKEYLYLLLCGEKEMRPGDRMFWVRKEEWEAADKEIVMTE